MHTTEQIDRMDHNTYNLNLSEACRRLAAIETLCGKYATPGSVVSTHKLAKDVIRIIQGCTSSTTTEPSE